MTDKEIMQMALDALELVTDLTNHDDEVYAAIEALRARLTQPELGVTLTAAKHPVSLSKPSEYRLSKESLEDVVLEREWQGLTDEEILEEYRQSYGDEGNLTDVYFARAIEAKLKEKNNG